MAKKLTDIAIRNLKATAARREIPDGGCAGLYVVVQPSGHRSYAVRYRADGRSRKLTLPGGLSLAAARKAAGDALLAVTQGKDPVAAKRRRRQDASKGTLAGVAARYLELEGSKLRSAAWRTSILDRLVLPQLGKRPVTDINRSDVVCLLDHIEQNNGPVAADRALAVLSKVFNWYAVRDDDFKSPLVRGMHRTNGRERARSRVLTDDELRRLWTASKDAGPFGAFVRFLLLTAARRNEAACMTWAEVVGADWRLPAARNKAKVDLLRPLSEDAQRILEGQPRYVGCPFVFTLNGRTAVSDFHRQKTALDAKAGVTGWCIHDLRRTARSLMSRAGVLSEHAERCLGHTVGTVVAATYDRHSYATEKNRAYEALASLLVRIVSGRSADVVSLRG
jgi:integrase